MSMEINNSGPSFNLDAYVTSAVEIMRYSARRRARREEAQSLQSELFGRRLSREQLFAYKSRLVEMQEQLEILEGLHDFEFPSFEPEWLGRPHKRVGGSVWVVSAPIEPVQLVTPSTQLEHRERWIETYRRATEEGEPLEIVRARIVVGTGSEQVETEMDDCVQVTPEGLHALQNPEWPVMTSRMPPIYPRRQDVMRFRRAA